MSTVSFTLQVRSVEQRQRTSRAKKNPDGTIETEVEDTGWWLVFSNHLAFGMGPERPPFEKGDVINVTLNKIEPANEG
jgi:hypothetical protein